LVLLAGDELTHIATGESGGDVPKQLVYIIAGSGGDLDVDDSETLGLSHRSLSAHLSLLNQIGFVSDEHY
jgi:hypothetical protein